MSDESRHVIKAQLLLTQREIDLIDLWRIEKGIGSRQTAMRALIGEGARAFFDHIDDAENEERKAS